MKKLEKIKLNAKDCVSLTDSMMKRVLGGSGGSGGSGGTHTCWCNNTNIGSGGWWGCNSPEGIEACTRNRS